VGHSCSGMVDGQVAYRAPARVAHTVFVDAFLPHDGKSMLDAFSEGQREDELRQISENGGRWPVPEAAGLAGERDLSAEHRRRLLERFVGHPGRTVSEPAVLSRPLAEQRSTYVACAFEVPDDLADLCEGANWTLRTLDTGHWPMVSAPDQLVALLAEVASEQEI
jgi:pimeloyl-ACP methyl ester carboxylesterase